jgi:hypothetical protein
VVVLEHLQKGQDAQPLPVFSLLAVELSRYLGLVNVGHQFLSLKA